MFLVNFSSKATKQIAKLDKQLKERIKNYLLKLQSAKTQKDLYDLGGTELVGNLKGLWRFKNSDFKGYRIIASLENDTLTIIVLAVESRNESYKNKDELAKKVRKSK